MPAGRRLESGSPDAGEIEQINQLKPKEEPPSLRGPKGRGNPVGRWIATSLRSSQ
jgi:hypothetical protein